MCVCVCVCVPEGENKKKVFVTYMKTTGLKMGIKHGNPVPSTGLPSRREIQSYWRESSGEPLRWLRHWSIWGKAGTVQPIEEKAQGESLQCI